MINYPTAQDVMQMSGNTGFTPQFNSEFTNILQNLYQQAYNSQYGALNAHIKQSMGHGFGPAGNSRARAALMQQVMGPAMQAAMQQQAFRNNLMQQQAYMNHRSGGSGGTGGGAMPGFGDGHFNLPDRLGPMHDSEMENAKRKLELLKTQVEVNKQMAEIDKYNKHERNVWAQDYSYKYGVNPLTGEVTDRGKYVQYLKNSTNPQAAETLRQMREQQQAVAAATGKAANEGGYDYFSPSTDAQPQQQQSQQQQSQQQQPSVDYSKYGMNNDLSQWMAAHPNMAPAPNSPIYSQYYDWATKNQTQYTDYWNNSPYVPTPQNQQIQQAPAQQPTQQNQQGPVGYNTSPYGGFNFPTGGFNFENGPYPTSLS